MTAPRTALRVGVDLGGTSSRLVAIDHANVVVASELVSTRAWVAGSGGSVGDQLTSHIRALVGSGVTESIGIGASGPIDCHGVIHNPDTMPEFTEMDLVSLLSSEFDVPCVIESDAAVFALGEFRLGAGRDVSSMIGVTLGTGVGACAILNGVPHRGADGLQPEAGHIPTPGPPAPCYCGLENCWEQRASRTALERLVLGRFPGETPATIAQAAAAGDEQACSVFTEYGAAVGSGLATLATLFRPQRFVIGGGSAAYLELMESGLHSALVRAGQYELQVDVTASKLGDLAGALGAATLISQS